VLTGVESGTYDVSPSAPTLVVPNQGKSGQSGKSVTIETGESVKGIDFDLVTKEALVVQVRDVSGEPVKGQTVELLLRGDDNYSRPFYSSAPGDHTTNDEGVYRISGVPPGRYIVKVGIAYGLAGYMSEKGHFTTRKLSIRAQMNHPRPRLLRLRVDAKPPTLTLQSAAL
jgi:hypothetical protein